MMTRLVIAAAASLLALSLTGCGEDHNKPTTTTSTAVESAAPADEAKTAVTAAPAEQHEEHKAAE